MTDISHTFATLSPGEVPADEFGAVYGTSTTQRQIVKIGGGQKAVAALCGSAETAIFSDVFPTPNTLYSFAGILTLLAGPNSNPKQIHTPRNAAAKAGSLILSTGRVPTFRDAADGTISSTTGLTGGVSSGVAIPLNTRVLVQIYSISPAGSTTSAPTGTAFCRITSLDGATTYLHVRSTAVHMGASVITNDQKGVLSGSAGECSLLWEMLRVSNDVAAIIEPAASPLGVSMFPAAVTQGSWTGDPLTLGDGDANSGLLSISNPTSTDPIVVVLPPQPATAITIYPQAYFLTTALFWTVQVFKSDGTTKIYERKYALGSTNAEEPVELDSAALAAIPNRSDRYALQLRLFASAS